MARKLGYQPNPLVANLMAQLHVQRRRDDPFNIAWIDLWPDDQESSGLQLLNPLLEGARRRASELGYGIEIHRPTRDGLSPDRLHRILVSRGQYALIVPPVPEAAMNYRLDLEGMAGVTIGTSLHKNRIHRVAPNLYQGSQLACHHLRDQGFRRIGLVLSEKMHERVEKSWTGAFLAEQQHWPKIDRLPPLLLNTWDRTRFNKWHSQYQPDAVLLSEPVPASWMKELSGGGRRRPSPIVWLLVEGRQPGVQGVDYRGNAIGAASVEMVVGQIHRNERGDPKIPNTLLLPGVWTAN